MSDECHNCGMILVWVAKTEARRSLQGGMVRHSTRVTNVKIVNSDQPTADKRKVFVTFYQGLP